MSVNIYRGYLGPRGPFRPFLPSVFSHGILKLWSNSLKAEVWEGTCELSGSCTACARVPRSSVRQVSVKAPQRGLADQLCTKKKITTSQCFPCNFPHTLETLFSSKNLHGLHFGNNYCSSFSGSTNRAPHGARARCSPALPRAALGHQSPDAAACVCGPTELTGGAKAWQEQAGAGRSRQGLHAGAAGLAGQGVLARVRRSIWPAVGRHKAQQLSPS